MATAKKAAPVPALKKAANVVSIKELQDKLATEVASLASRTSPPSGDVIQVSQDKKFRLPNGVLSNGPLHLVIVDFVSANKFYDGPFDKNSILPPACFAVGENPTQLVPSSNSPMKQSNSCGACPMNQFGSGGKGKACKNSRVLAVLPPDASEDDPLWILAVSPTALKSFDAYVSSIARQFNLPPVGVITEVSFDPNTTYASLRFSNQEPNKKLAEFYARKDEARKRLLVEPDVSSYETPAPAKKAGAVRRK